jgi:large subunit ribosomal protein L4
MPKKMRRAALCSALSVKAMDNGIVVVDALVLSEPKTRLMDKALNLLVGNASALVLIPENNTYEPIIRSTNNLPNAKTMLSNYLNIRDLLRYDKVVMPVAVLENITEHLG